MIQPLSQINAIFDEILDWNLSGSEQLVLLHLFNAFNHAHWTETIQLSDEMLQSAINQYDSNGKPASLDTVRRAKQKLKKKGLINFTSGRGSDFTKYHLVKLYPADTPADTPAHLQTSSMTTYNPKIRKKTRRREEGATATSETRVREGVLNQEIVNIWQDKAGKLSSYEYRMLFQFQQKYGTEKVVYAVKESIELNVLNVRYVQRILERLEGKGDKGGWTNGRNGKNRQSDADRQQFDSYDWNNAWDDV